MEEKEIMSFRNEDGEKVDFEAVAKIYAEEKEYFILSPVEGNKNEDDAFPFRVDLEDGKEVLNLVEDDAEFKMVKKEYAKLLYHKD